MANNKPKNNGSVNGNHKTELEEVASSNNDTATVSRKKKTVSYKTGNSRQLHSDELDNRYLLQVLTEVKNGNFNLRMPIDQVGLSGKICDTLNEINDSHDSYPPSF